ncbi:putative nucleic-acid-binding protein [Archaeoglobus fulgidus DSM 8774]|uniref:Putative nucleic-acid-binding protein n=1 Tax=Archaeoglobus fulgidus DSM 8774 TaxID=1344584 RepID=A0A075WD69_ARCFL|nr:Zn-ribbon domain-containing OB-fold protein [Archaeoglobus fulgidus]AIG97104.1 putative nucleic-acid-binding protein [Archaeoglobus fulgidus DSM 8774]
MKEEIKKVIEETGLPIITDEKSGAAQWVDLRELRLSYIISVENIKPFYEGLKEGKLLGTKCKKCGRLFFPPQKDCPSCFDSDIEWVELKNEGTLETMTVVFVRPPSFSAYDPYPVAIAKLDDGPRILAWYKGDPQQAKPGMSVKIQVGKRKEGYLMYEIAPA